jgi:protease IV
MSRWKITLLVIALIFLISVLLSSFFNDFSAAKIDSRIAVIPIYGEITLEDSNGIFSISQVASANTIVEQIKKSQEDPTIKGIIFEINSPGGTVVASEEIANAIKKLNKPKIAWIREVGASGAYWAASSTDKIIADPMSITGSIGVLGSYIEFSGLMQKYGVTYEQLNGGKYKDLGSPYTNLTNDERILLQSKIDRIHEYFINDVAKNRNMSVEKMRKLADGSFYLGLEAKENGLVDELGGKQEAIDSIKNIAGIKDVYLVTYGKKSALSGLFSSSLSYSSFYIGQGIATGLKNQLSNDFTIKT